MAIQQRRKKRTKPLESPQEETVARVRKKRKTLEERRAENKKKAERKTKSHTRVRYKKKKCMFVKENGVRCANWAVGRSTLCIKHGGELHTPETSAPSSEMFAIQANSKFNPAVHPMRFIELSRDGLSDTEIAAQFQVSPITIRNWSDNYHEFSIAYDVGKAMHEAWWLTKGKEGLSDYRFNTSLFKFLTGNLLGYADKVETKNVNANLNHGVLVVPDKLSVSEWEKKVEESQNVVDI